MQIERIEKQGDTGEIWGIKSAKTFRDFLNNKIKYFSSRNQEYMFVMQSILQAYDRFNPQLNVAVEIEGWQGKSSFQIIKGVEKITIIKYKRKDKNSEPEKQEVEVSNKELSTLIECIKRLDEGKTIETKSLARAYCISLGIMKTTKGKQLFQGVFWDNFFSWRQMHNRFTLMLGALDKLGFIKYVGGKTQVVNKEFTIQTIL